jgi:hypothetical protein
MTWLNPLALVGLLALAVPILVHLFGRRVARRQRFPSLRLLQLASTTPTTRSQPSDILLLLLRCAVVAAAVLALAQPRWTTPGRSRQSLAPARAVVVDTSASTARLTSDGRSALEHAQGMARALLDSSREGMLVQTNRPGANIAGAASWLGTRSGMREVVVISDFQRGAVSDGDLAAVPLGVGIRLQKVLATARLDPMGTGDSAITVRIDPATDDVDVTWQAPVSDSAALPVTVFSAPDDEGAARASIAVAGRLYPRTASTHAIAFVFPGYPGTAALASQLEPLRQPWQGDFLLGLNRHPLFRDNTDAAEPRPCSQNGALPLRNAQGVPVATLGSLKGGSAHGLVVFSCVEAGSLAGTALLAAVVGTAAQVAPFPELEPTTVPDETLRQWERPATETEPRGQDETSPDGRWLWLLALGLLVAEEWFRRKRPSRTTAVQIERQERVA